MMNLDRYLALRFARLEGQRVEPRDEEQEDTRRQRVERLCASTPKIKTAARMFDEQAALEAAAVAQKNGLGPSRRNRPEAT